MSLRKAKQILEMQKKKQEKVQEIDEEETQIEKPAKKNLFSAFQESDQQIKQQTKDIPVQQIPTKQRPKEDQEKKKKKKKAKKNEKKAQEQDLEKIIQQTLGAKVKLQHQHTKQESDDELQLFTLNQSKFKYQNELKKYFKNIKQEVVEQNFQGMNKRQKKIQKFFNNQKMKKSIIAPGTKEYFPIAEKFTVQTKNHVIVFQPGKKYETLQEEYQVIKNSNDVQEMMNFVQKNPYHTDALYNIGQFFRLKGNYKEADTFIQRIIYIYEYSCYYEIGLLFKQDKPINQFQYSRFSISFFMSLFKFIDILGKKGCYKAALEYNKLLLKLNLEDPTACLLCFDYNACSSKQYQYLIQFTNKFTKYYGNKNQTIYWLPNFIYSVALAKFNLLIQSNLPTKQTIIDQINIDNLITFTKQDFQKAINLVEITNLMNTSPQVLILRAILLYPRVINLITQKTQYSKQQIFHKLLNQGYQKKNFKEIASHDFFSKAPQSYFYVFLNLDNESDNKGFNKVIQAYVERSKILWKNNRVMIWVKAAMGFILNEIQANNFQYNKFLQDLCIADQLNSKIYKIPFQLRRYERVIKANFSDHVDRIDLNNIQDNQGPLQQPNRPQGGRPLNMQGNAFSLFLNSLLPWVNLPQQQQQQNQEEDPDMPVIEQDHD